MDVADGIAAGSGISVRVGARGAAVGGAISVGVAVAAAEQAVSSRTPNTIRRIPNKCYVARLQVAVATATVRKVR